MWSHLREKGVKIPNISAGEIDRQVEPVLRAMENAGILIDRKVLSELQRRLEIRISKLEKEIYKAAGEKFNINSPSQMAELLFKKLKLPIFDLKKTKSGISTAAPELSKLKSKHKIIEPVLEYRELSKLVSTYLKPLPALVTKDGRIHTTYGQETSTGRMTSKNPNLQNIPIKGELGDEIRKAFIAPERMVLISADYSQIELRIVACLAQDEVMLKAFESGVDIHSKTASEIFGVPADKVTKEQRRAAKTVNFGVLYGQTSYGLSQALGINRQDAQNYIDKYFDVHTGIARYVKNMRAKADKDGYVETLFGFRRNIAELKSENWQTANAGERMAINTPVQGTAAEILKLAMIELDKEINRRPTTDDPPTGEAGRRPRLILTVHDELVAEAPEEDAESVSKMIKEVMEGAVKLCVPLEVEVAYGKNWLEAKH